MMTLMTSIGGVTAAGKRSFLPMFLSPNLNTRQVTQGAKRKRCGIRQGDTAKLGGDVASGSWRL